METFEAYPNHRALAALRTVAQQIGTRVNHEMVERAKEAHGDHGNRATRQMLKAILGMPGLFPKPRKKFKPVAICSFQNGWQLFELPYDRIPVAFVSHMHVDWSIVSKALPANLHLIPDDRRDGQIRWKVIDSATFQGRRAVAHGGHMFGSPFGLMDTEESKPCFFKPCQSLSRDIDHHQNLLTLIRTFDVVFVKHDLDFVLPDDLFCCVYEWPADVPFNAISVAFYGVGRYSSVAEPNFVVVLRKKTPREKFDWQ